MVIKKKTAACKIYEFLSESDHHEFNASIQQRTYEAWLSTTLDNKQRAYTVLFECAKSQSRPKLDHLCTFWKLLRDNPSWLHSFQDFAHGLGVSESTLKQEPYRALFAALKEQSGWGNKTAALFIRHLIAIHADSSMAQLRFWEDTPPLTGKDYLYLPVDRVISDCFARIGFSGDFMTINSRLRDYGFNNSHILLWDDLWFWGFINQWSNAKGGKRSLRWNEGKYFALRWSDKSPDSITRIKELSSAFVALL